MQTEMQIAFILIRLFLFRPALLAQKNCKVAANCWSYDKLSDLAGKCTRASYNTAKRISRRVVHHARHEADKVVYEGIDHKSSDIFRLANQMRKENVDVVGDKPVKNDTGEMSMSEEAKQNAWAEHYERLQR